MVEGINAVSKAQGITSAKTTVQTKDIDGIVFFTKKGLKPEQEVAIKSLQEQIAKGNATYNDPGFFETIGNFLIDGKTGDYIRIENYADPNEKVTLGDVKQILKLNLPPGSLRCNKTERGGGNFDLYKAPQYDNGQYYIDIFVDDLIEGTGLTKNEIEVMFSV